MITLKDFKAEAELLENERPKTCEAIWNALPVEAELEIWKEEVYFELPVKIPLENPTPKTVAGDVCYWPNGPALCIFFGGSQPISPVTTFAKIESGLEKFCKLRGGERVTVNKSFK